MQTATNDKRPLTIYSDEYKQGMSAREHAVFLYDLIVALSSFRKPRAYGARKSSRRKGICEMGDKCYGLDG